jgi:hypothetical protein
VQGGTDAPGVISLILGCVSIALFLLGFVTCGTTYFLAFPLALIGFVLGCCARGNLQVAGLTPDPGAAWPSNPRRGRATR